MSSLFTLALPALWITAACGGSAAASDPDANAPCEPSSNAPTYSQLYTKYFAVGTPGHCATDGCHNGAGFNIWFCGSDKNTCYQGMTGTLSGPLVDPAHPAMSLIIDRQTSPLSWFNPGGPMPFDAMGPFPEGAAAIHAWVCNGAKND